MSTAGPESDADTGTDADTDPVPTPTVYSHVRATDATDSPVEPGVYRVVGASPESMTILRVGDAGDRRVHTGEVISVDRDDFEGFEPAENPDGNHSVTAALTGALEGFVLQIRAFLDGLAARPLASLAAGVLLVVGHQGDRFVSGPDAAFTAVYLVGGLALFYLGTRGG